MPFYPVAVFGGSLDMDYYFLHGFIKVRAVQIIYNRVK